MIDEKTADVMYGYGCTAATMGISTLDVEKMSDEELNAFEQGVVDTLYAMQDHDADPPGVDFGAKPKHEREAMAFDDVSLGGFFLHSDGRVCRKVSSLSYLTLAYSDGSPMPQQCVRVKEGERVQREVKMPAPA